MKLKKFLYSEKVAPYIFVIPFILSFAFFWIYPLITSVTMSFQDIGAIKSEWVGLANYQKLLKDNVFHTAIWNSTKITIRMMATAAPRIQVMEESVWRTLITPPMPRMGAYRTILNIMVITCCTCCTSLVLRVIRDAVENL